MGTDDFGRSEGDVQVRFFVCLSGGGPGKVERYQVTEILDFTGYSLQVITEYNRMMLWRFCSPMGHKMIEIIGKMSDI